MIGQKQQDTFKRYDDTPFATRGGDFTDQTSQPNLRNLNFTNTLYQLAYSQVLLQHLNSHALDYDSCIVIV